MQVFFSSSKANINLDLLANPIKINNIPIEFSKSAEHVGILRSTEGNGPTILARIAAYKRALGAVLHVGMARNHRGNPVYSLRVHQLYCVPVLFSGLAPLVLSTAEIALVEQQFKDTLLKLLRLPGKTPRSVVYFMSGCIPGTAHLHLRQLSLFGMISRLKDSILHEHAMSLFSAHTICKLSWFHQIRDWCLLYGLPHPIDLLRSPLPKQQYKLLVKKKILSYWEHKLRQEASLLPSLEFFRPDFMSLSKPHPLWLTAGSSPSKICMASVQANLISGRYRTESLTRHWSNNSNGVCLLSSVCQNLGSKEDIRHILQWCPALEDTRDKLTEYTRNKVSNLDAYLQHEILGLCSVSNPSFCQFLLDCSTISTVISLVQLYGTSLLSFVFEISRTWVYGIHRERLRRLGRWNAS